MRSCAIGVAHIAKACVRIAARPAELPASLFPSFAGARLVGVGHKPKSISAMGRIDGTSRDNGRPAGVTDAFHVSMHSVEPMFASRCRNLLSHVDRGPATGDEAVDEGAKKARVGLSKPFARDAVGLARFAPGPKRAIIWPASKSSCEAPSSDAGEKVTLSVTPQIVRLNVDNRSLIHIPRRYMPCGNQVSQPLRRVRLDLVVVGSHDFKAFSSWK